MPEKHNRAPARLQQMVRRVTSCLRQTPEPVRVVFNGAFDGGPRESRVTQNAIRSSIAATPALAQSSSSAPGMLQMARHLPICVAIPVFPFPQPRLADRSGWSAFGRTRSGQRVAEMPGAFSVNIRMNE